MQEGLFDCIGQLRFVASLSHADRGARVGGLDKDGEAEPTNCLLAQGGGIFLIAIAGQGEPLCLRNARHICHGVCNRLIHRDSGGGAAAADEGELRKLQKALHGAVLPVFAVQDGEHHIHMLHACRAVFKNEQAVMRGVRREHSGRPLAAFEPVILR